MFSRGKIDWGDLLKLRGRDNSFRRKRFLAGDTLAERGSKWSRSLDVEAEAGPEGPRRTNTKGERGVKNLQRNLIFRSRGVRLGGKNRISWAADRPAREVTQHPESLTLCWHRHCENATQRQPKKLGGNQFGTGSTKISQWLCEVKVTKLLPVFLSITK